MSIWKSKASLLILKAFKYRIYPTEEQEADLRIQFGHARFVYNRFIDTRKSSFLTNGKGVSFYDFKKQVTLMKQQPDFVWLKDADSQVLQASLEDADRAYQNFFRNHKNGTLPPPGKKPRKDGTQRVPAKGYPAFWGKHDDQSIRYPQRFEFEGRKIYLPKVAWVKVVRHRRIEGEMKNCTVSKTKTGRYFVSIQCAIETDVQPTINLATVGVDLGLKDFAILNTEKETIKIAPPKHLRKAENLVKIRQRRISRKVKGSNSRNKARLRVAATHEKIANRRKDFHHKESRKIVNQFGSIGLETLNRELKLKDRTWVCQNCGGIHDRDENAAKNLRPKKSTAGVAGTRPSPGPRGNPCRRVEGQRRGRDECACKDLSPGKVQGCCP